MYHIYINYNNEMEMRHSIYICIINIEMRMVSYWSDVGATLVVDEKRVMDAIAM
jgi:hypothetical protein